MDVTTDQRCFFLTRLPIELRLEIYAHLLAFSAPLKLRQVIPGSRDLPILRTNRQIHDEALSVLYEFNTIVVTRNGTPCPPYQTSASCVAISEQGALCGLWQRGQC